jgi:hypothetical protein
MATAELRRNKTFEKMQVVKKMVEQDLIFDEDASYLAEELEKECE